MPRDESSTARCSARAPSPSPSPSTPATRNVDNGPDTSRYTLVLVAEGYQNSELTQFHQDCQDLVDHLFATPPFDELDLRCAFNVYRVDVSSTDSGADDPSTCGGAGVS